MASAAYNDGAEFGAALQEVMQVNTANVNQGALFLIGKRFALMSQYRELNAGLDWVAGFCDGFMGRTSTKAIASGQSSDSSN